jgi:excisionase family DNA binding protein
MISRYLTPDELCEMCQIKKQKLYKMTSRRLIPFLKIGNELRFDPEEVQKTFHQNCKTDRKILL